MLIGLWKKGRNFPKFHVPEISPYETSEHYLCIAHDSASPVGSLAKETTESIKSILGKAGANAVTVSISERIDIDGDRMLEARRTEAIGARPKEDPDLRFPIVDVRLDAVKRRTANGNHNLLRLHHAVRDLSKEALRHEKRRERTTP